MKKKINTVIGGKKVDIEIGHLAELARINKVNDLGNSDDVYGVFSEKRRGPHKILISEHKNKIPQEMLDTLIHEIFHAIIRFYKVPVFKKREEEIVSLLSKALSDTLLNNRDLWSLVQSLVKNNNNLN